MEILKFVFSSIWVFIGVAMFLTGLANFILIAWNRFLRHMNIRKHGYPPAHCDADGDSLTNSEDDSL